MLKIKIPNICENEQIYSLDILIGEFLGLEFEVEAFESNFIEITRLDSFDKYSKLTIDASFFNKAKKDWLKTQSMPVLPLKTWTPSALFLCCHDMKS
jgi:hypothetical protein